MLRPTLTVHKLHNGSLQSFKYLSVGSLNTGRNHLYHTPEFLGTESLLRQQQHQDQQGGNTTKTKLLPHKKDLKTVIHQLVTRQASRRSTISTATSAFDFNGKSRLLLSAPIILILLVSPIKPAPSSAKELKTIKSSFFFSSFRRAFSSSLAVSSTKPATTCPGLTCRPNSRAISGSGTSCKLNSAPLRLIFCSAASATDNRPPQRPLSPHHRKERVPDRPRAFPGR